MSMGFVLNKHQKIELDEWPLVHIPMSEHRGMQDMRLSAGGNDNISNSEISG